MPKQTAESREARGQTEKRKNFTHSPEHRLPAYTFFANKETPGIKFGKVATLSAEKWNDLTNEEREPYYNMAKAASDDQQEYERLFTERPRGLSEKSAWLRQLEKQHGQAWYDRFSHWYTARLSHPKTQWQSDNIDGIFHIINWAPRQASWHPTDPSLKELTYYLSNAPISAAPDLYVGRYNGCSIGVVLNGSALCPPQVGINTFKSLSVQYAHLPIFAGLHIKESKDYLCLLILGNMYASTTKVPSNNDDWFDTKFVLALNTAHGWRKREFLLVYKYEVYSIDYFDDGSEKRSEESEHEIPPQFCNGPDAFTVAVCETESSLLSKIEVKPQLHLSHQEPLKLADIKLAVRSVKKPDLVVAGYVDDEHPYTPVFPLTGD